MAERAGGSCGGCSSAATAGTPGRCNGALPVIVEADVLVPGVPRRVLRLSRANALCLDGVLIPVEFLINRPGPSRITQPRYHLELAL